jgi:hypothetical protein
MAAAMPFEDCVYLDSQAGSLRHFKAGKYFTFQRVSRFYDSESGSESRVHHEL